jgi:hypothetical protein
VQLRRGTGGSPRLSLEKMYCHDRGNCRVAAIVRVNPRIAKQSGP